MKNILLIHGPNLNRLGKRDPEQYGHLTLADLESAVQTHAQTKGYQVLCFQSNHEGELIDYIQAQAEQAHAIIINPGALTHYSYALYDALIDSKIPTIEVHLSNIKEREPFRAHSVIAPACLHSIMGKKLQGYIEAIDRIVEHIDHEH